MEAGLPANRSRRCRIAWSSGAGAVAASPKERPRRRRRARTPPGRLQKRRCVCSTVDLEQAPCAPSSRTQKCRQLFCPRPRETRSVATFTQPGRAAQVTGSLVALIRRRLLSRLVIAAVVGVQALVAASAQAAAPAWTTYRHDAARSGIDPDSTVPVMPAPAWQTPAPDGEVYGQPLVYGAYVYVTTENDTVSSSTPGRAGSCGRCISRRRSPRRSRRVVTSRP